MRRLSRHLVLFILWTTACNGQALDPARFCVEYTEIFCSGNQSCCMRSTDVYASATTCESARASACGLSNGATFDDGRAIFDSAVAAQALSEARSAVATCAPLPSLWAYDLVRGSIAIGEDCSPVGADTSPTVSCVDGATCVLTSAGALGFSGQCVAVDSAGDNCDAETCAPGLYCDTSAGAGVCTAKRPSGSACTANEQCATDSCVSLSCSTPSDGSTYCIAGAQTAL